MNQLNATTKTLSCPLNSIMYRKGGRMKAIAADPMDPAIFKKSVKLGISKDIPVINQTIIDLAITFLTLFLFLLPPAKNSCVSYISKAARICTG